jgi:hypothetical protein
VLLDRGVGPLARAAAARTAFGCVEPDARNVKERSDGHDRFRTPRANC